jgi:hypothetical protein
LRMSLKKLWAHVFKWAACNILHSYSCNRAKNSKIDNFDFDTRGIKSSFIVVDGLLGQHDILEFKIPVNYLAVMAVVYGLQKLYENLISILFRKLPIRLRFPEVVKFAPFQKLHDN